MATVGHLAMEREIAAVEEIAQHRNWPFERVGPQCFRVSLSAQNGDIYQIEVECDDFPVRPAAFHWRNRETGQLDDKTDAPLPYDYFHEYGRICAPWNRLASTPGGPHLEWVQASWREQPETQGTVTLAAMVLRIHHELRSSRYKGRRG